MSVIHRLILASACGCGAFSSVRASSAQHCVPVLSDARSWATTLALEAASYRTAHSKGTWFGARLEVEGAISPLSARVWFPAYRLERNGLAFTGLGDVGVGARVAFLNSEKETYVGGVDLAVTLPTGAVENDLGMGHPMEMGGPFGSVRLGNWALGANVALGGALTTENAGPHAGQGEAPIVSPMNQSELEAGALLRWEFASRWSAESNVSGALPIAAERGRTRASGGLGPAVKLGPLELRLRFEFPIVGNPFRARTTLAAGWAFGS